MNQHRPVGLLAGTEPITDFILKDAKEYLKVISRGRSWLGQYRQTGGGGTGYSGFSNRRGTCQAVAELTLGMSLSDLRAVPLHDRQIRGGVWKKGMGRLLQEKVVGLIGFGSIGQRVGELVKAFGARVIYNDLRSLPVSWAKQISLYDLLTQSDIITIHASGSEQILREKELNSLCKHGVILVNTARGGLVDEKALHKCLVSGQVSYARLDVFDQEPYYGLLTEPENVILTPQLVPMPERPGTVWKRWQLKIC